MISVFSGFLELEFVWIFVIGFFGFFAEISGFLGSFQKNLKGKTLVYLGCLGFELFGIFEIVFFGFPGIPVISNPMVFFGIFTMGFAFFSWDKSQNSPLCRKSLFP